RPPERPSGDGVVRGLTGGWQPPPSPTQFYVPRRERYGSDLFDLTVFELHRSGTPENRNFHLEARALLVDFLDDARKARERPVRHPDVLADLEADGRLGPVDALLHLLENGHR